MAFTSEVTLCGNVPLDPRYEHTLTFTSKEAQLAWFTGMKRYEPFDDFSYLRKESAIKVPIDAEALENAGVNYLFTINESKVRYYFVTAKEYISESCTKLHVELDVLQTYQFDWTIPACFVEREHVSDDSIGANLMDEGLELGEYVTNSVYNAPLGSLAIVVQSSVSLTNDPGIGEPIRGSVYGGVYSGLKLYARSCNATGALVIDAIIKSLEVAGKADGITSMWVYPKRFITTSISWDLEDTETMLEVVGINPLDITMDGNSSLEGYSPRNKKLLCYPYNFLYAHNNMGECAFYHYEKFTGGPKFRITGTVAEDGVIRASPMNYDGMTLDNDAGISLGGFPTCAWTQDAYKIWLAQNANTQALAIQSGYISAGVGSAMMGAAAVQAIVPGGESGGMLASSGVQQMYSGYQQIASVMAARKDAEVQPPQARGKQSSSCNLANSMHTITFQRKSVTKEFASAIDDYFDMYGYKVCRVKTPNIKGRQNWNYVKTIGAVVLGDIDAADRVRIGAILDKGVTFWHNYLTMYNYTKSNGVI